MLKNGNSISILVFLVISLASYLIFALFDYQSTAVVHSSSGKVQGFVSLSRNGREYSQFLGIPYAQPPVGLLRFEDPEPPLRWNGTLKAVSYGAKCPGFDFLLTRRYQGEESCLFLNVMTPAIRSQGSSNKKPLMPVLVFIHGGGFHFGSSNMVPGKFFMDHDIVLVTINYRLGIFGFLITADGKVRGNMGLKDQVMALKWVQANIKHFGGDPNQVTIMGSSAGGGSVHFLMLSKMAQGLFHRAISNSNEALSDLWQFSRNHTTVNEHIAKTFNCPLQSTQEFVKCLRSVDAEDLVSYHERLNTPFIFNNVGGLGPAIENEGPNAFLSEDPMILLKEGRIPSKVPWMAGVNQFESFISLGHLFHYVDITKLVTEDDTWTNMLPHLLFYNATLQPDVGLKVKDEFLRRLKGTDEHEIIEALASLVSEKMMFKPLMTSALLQSSFSPVYLYLYNYKASVSVFNFIRWVSFESFMPAEVQIAYNLVIDSVLKLLAPWIPYHHYGASHGDELLMLFNVPGTEHIISSFDFKMSEIMVKTIVDFTKVRMPITFQNLSWPKVDPSKPFPIMELKEGKPEVLHDPFTGLQFWKDLNIART